MRMEDDICNECPKSATVLDIIKRMSYMVLNGQRLTVHDIAEITGTLH